MPRNHALPPYQRERAQRFARICKAIHLRVQRGEKLRKLLVRPVWIWKDRFYKCDPARPTAFSKGTLLRVYYQWRDHGQNAAAIRLRYRCGQKKLHGPELTAILNAARMPAVTSFRQARQRIASPNATESAYRYALPPRIYTAMCRAFALRRRALALNAQAARLLKQLRTGA